MDKELEQVGSWVQKHAKHLIVVLLVALLLGTPFGMSILGIVNPGFPGAHVAFYGVTFNDFGTDWTGTNVLHVAGSGETTLASESTWYAYRRVYWDTQSTSYGSIARDDSGTKTYPELETRVESSIPLANFNYQNSTPLILNSTAAWDQGNMLYYQTLHNTTSADGQTVTWNWTSTDILLIPGNFHIDVDLLGSQNNPGTASGWTEGSWNAVELWYVMYWYEWLNAFTQSDFIQYENIPSYLLDRTGQFNIRGGFPIAGWIQYYMIPVQTDYGIVQNIFQFKTSDKTTLAGSQINPTTLSNILTDIHLDPSLNGNYVDMFTQASDQYSIPAYGLPAGNASLNSVQTAALSHSPDPQTMPPTQFFKITIPNLGTYVEGHGFLNLGGYTVYYPAVSYLMRFIFGVYGTHSYIWTVSTAAQQGYNATQNYIQPPAQWQSKTVDIANGGGLGLSWPSFSWGDLFGAGNIEAFLIIGAIIVLVVTVFNPGVWANILHRRKD